MRLRGDYRACPGPAVASAGKCAHPSPLRQPSPPQHCPQYAAHRRARLPGPPASGARRRPQDHTAVAAGGQRAGHGPRHRVSVGDADPISHAARRHTV